MSKKSNVDLVRAESIDLGEFIEVVTASVSRAVAAKGNKGQPPILIGAHIPISDSVLERNSSPNDRKNESHDMLFATDELFTTDELKELNTGMEINKQSLGKVTDMLKRDYPRSAIKFANSLGTDFDKTMDKLFDLSEEQRDSFRALSQGQSKELRKMSNILTTVIDDGSCNKDDTGDITIVYSEKKKEKDKKITISFEGTTKKEFKTEVKFEWTF